MENEIYSLTCMVIWAMAATTKDHVGAATRDSLGTQFLIKAIAASARLWSERYKPRDKATRRKHGVNMADYLKSLRGRNRGNESADDAGSGGEEPQED